MPQRLSTTCKNSGGRGPPRPQLAPKPPCCLGNPRGFGAHEVPALQGDPFRPRYAASLRPCQWFATPPKRVEKGRDCRGQGRRSKRTTHVSRKRGRSRAKDPSPLERAPRHDGPSSLPEAATKLPLLSGADLRRLTRYLFRGGPRGHEAHRIGRGNRSRAGGCRRRRGLVAASQAGSLAGNFRRESAARPGCQPHSPSPGA